MDSGSGIFSWGDDFPTESRQRRRASPDPPFGLLQQEGILQRDGSRAHVRLDIHCRLTGAFFRRPLGGGWNCFNDFTLECSPPLECSPTPFGRSNPLDLNDGGLPLPFHFTPLGSPSPDKVYGLVMAISAVYADSDQHVIELIRHPIPQRFGLSPAPHTTRSGLPISDQLELKFAMANKGQRRAAQQHFILVVELLGELGADASGDFIKIAERRSAKLSVVDKNGSQRFGVTVLTPVGNFNHDVVSRNYPKLSSSQKVVIWETSLSRAPTEAPTISVDKKYSESFITFGAASSLMGGLKIEIPHFAVQDSNIDNLRMVDRPQPLERHVVEASPDPSDPSGSESATEVESTSDYENTGNSWVRERGQTAINSVMKSFCQWLDSKASSIRNVATGQGDASGNSREASSSTPEQNSAGSQGEGHRRNLKRKQTDADENDDHGRGMGRNSGISKIVQSDQPQRFACPYFKRDPWKYCRETTCVGPGWVQVHRVKDHLYRRHELPPQCPRCWQDFKTEGLRDVHLQNDPPCKKRPNDTILDGFTKAQKKQLKSRKKSEMNATDEGKWREMYLILFPDDDPATIPSPYHEDVSMATTGASRSNTPADFAAFARREYPRFVRRELDVLFESEFQDIEERIRPRVQDIVLNLQPRLIALYEQSAANASNSGEETIPNDGLPPRAQGDMDVEEVQSTEASAPNLPPDSHLAVEESSISWLPEENSRPAAFDPNIDWDLVFHDIFGNLIPGQFALPPQQDVSHRDDLQGTGQRQETSA